MTQIHRATFGDLSTEQLYDVLKLRVNVFVVEQRCPYPEIDDLDKLANHYWINDEKGIASYLRTIQEVEGLRIGRVVTRYDARSQGYSGQLISHVVQSSDGPWTLSAQAYLRDWYSELGFIPVGPEFLEDDIPHIPMRRDKS